MKYFPLFGQIVDSSLWAEDDVVVKVFLTLLAKQDPDHVVRGSLYNISRWACKENEQEEVARALKILASPDQRRVGPQAHDGRRIEQHEEGWLILNGEKYHKEMIRVNRLLYQRQKQAEYRLREKLKNSPQATERQETQAQ